MLASDILIKASNEQDARQKAAEHFDTPASNIRLAQAENGQFKAEMIHRDAQLDISIADDEMSAYINSALPHKGEGRPLSIDLLKRILDKEGVLVAPIPETAQTLVKAISAGKILSKQILIARGKQPDPARDASLEPLGDWKFPVFPGDSVFS